MRSFITSLAEGEKLKSGERVMDRGIAFDGGYGIENESLLENGGPRLARSQTWQGSWQIFLSRMDHSVRARNKRVFWISKSKLPIAPARRSRFESVLESAGYMLNVI